MEYEITYLDISGLHEKINIKARSISDAVKWFKNHIAIESNILKIRLIITS